MIGAATLHADPPPVYPAHAALHNPLERKVAPQRIHTSGPTHHLRLIWNISQRDRRLSTCTCLDCRQTLFSPRSSSPAGTSIATVPVSFPLSGWYHTSQQIGRQPCLTESTRTEVVLHLKNPGVAISLLSASVWTRIIDSTPASCGMLTLFQISVSVMILVTIFVSLRRPSRKWICKILQPEKILKRTPRIR